MTLTSKRRAELRAVAHRLAATVHVGHQGLTETVKQSLDDALRTQELVKIQFSRNDDVNVKEAANDLARAMGGDLAVESHPAIGSTFRFAVALKTASEKARSRSPGSVGSSR